MAFELSRVDRLSKSYDLAARYPNLDGPFTAADVALLPPRSNPNGATLWEPAGVTAGIATILFAGPDADSSGAVVVTGSADLWLRVTVGAETDAVKVERITLLGSGTVIAPGPLPQVLSVQGRTGAVSLTASDVGADAAGAATAAQAAAIAAIPSMSTIAEQARDAVGAALVVSGGLTKTVDDAGDIIGLSIPANTFEPAGTSAGTIIGVTPGGATVMRSWTPIYDDGYAFPARLRPLDTARRLLRVRNTSTTASLDLAYGSGDNSNYNNPGTWPFTVGPGQEWVDSSGDSRALFARETVSGIPFTCSIYSESAVA